MNVLPSEYTALTTRLHTSNPGLCHTGVKIFYPYETEITVQSIYAVMILIGVPIFYPYENVIVYVMADISCKDIWCHVDSRRCIEILLSNQSYPEIQHLTVISTEGGRRQTGEGGSRQQTTDSSKR